LHLKWTSKSQGDLARVYSFLAKTDEAAAARVVLTLLAAPDRLLSHPRIGEKLDEFAPREVRRIFIGPYELRYEIRPNKIIVLRVWHGREDR
jgi:plasmid stabilization system protein ParE